MQRVNSSRGTRVQALVSPATVVVLEQLAIAITLQIHSLLHPSVSPKSEPALDIATVCASICGVIGPESVLDCGTVVVVELYLLNATKKVTLLGVQVG